MKKIILLVFLCFHRVRSLTNVELEFLTQFMRFLSRSNCVLLDDANGLKHLAENFISTAYLAGRNAPGFLYREERRTADRIVLVAKGHDLTGYEYIYDTLPNSRLISRFTWILILNATLDFSTIQGRAIIPYDSEFFLVEPSGESSYQILEICRERNTPNVLSNLFGSWSLRHGLAASKLNFFSRRRNLHGYPMTVLRPQENCHSPMQCSLREIWFDLAMYLNITTSLLTIEEHERRVWETNKEVPWDVNLDPMTYDAYTPTTKAIAPIWKLTVFMHVRHEADLEFSWPIYFSTSWRSPLVYILIWMVTLIFWLTMFDFLLSLYVRKRKFYSSNGFFAVLFWICNQGGIYTEPTYSLLILTGMMRIVLLTLQNFGSGILVSYLSLKIPHYPFYGLEEFVTEGNKYKLIVPNGSISQFYVQFNPLGEESGLWGKFLSPADMPGNLTEVMEMLCADGKFVALAENNDLLALEEKKCEILQIPFPVASIFCGISLHDESSFEFIFNTAFTRIVESGIINKMRKKYYGRPKEGAEKGSHLHPITLHQVKPFFVVVQCGIALSLVVWTVESLCHTRRSREKKMKRRKMWRKRGHV